MMRRWEGTEEKNKFLHRMGSRGGTQIEAVSLEFDVLWPGMMISLLPRPYALPDQQLNYINFVASHPLS